MGLVMLSEINAEVAFLAAWYQYPDQATGVVMY
jgi:hypothetical protein